MKRIIIELGKPPLFEGEWTIGEALDILHAVIEWLRGLPIRNKSEEQP